MAVAFGSTFTRSTGSATVSLTDPGAAGDFLLVILSDDSSTATWSPPAGGAWTQISTDSITADGQKVAAYYNKSGTGGSANYDFVSAGPGVAQGGIIASFTGCDATSPVNGTFAKAINNTANPDPWFATAPQIITQYDGCMIVFCGFVDPSTASGTDSWTAPIGMTRQIQFTDTSLWNGMTICTVAQVLSGGFGGVSATDVRGAGNNAGTAGYLFALRPRGPVINTQPVKTTVGAGQTATFTVSATTSGGALSYQWKANGSNVGTNSTSYTTGTLSLSDNGTSITVDVTDSNGTLVSRSAILTVTGTGLLAWFKI